MGKLKNAYTINMDDDTAQTLEALARATQRKPAELLRLLCIPSIYKAWQDLQREQHPENNTAPEVATFKPLKDY